MRITHQMLAGDAIRYMEENLERLSDLQQKIATGKRYNRSSDNPSVAAAGLSLRSSLESSQAYLDTAEETDTWLSTTEFALKDVVEIATRAINLALDGLSDTQGPSERQAMATEMGLLLEEAIDLGNTSLEGSYIFAGFKTRTAPFTLVTGTPDSVNYNGDAGNIQRNVGPGQKISVNLDGDATLSPLYAAIIETRDALQANDTAAIDAGLANLNTALDGVVDARTVNGGRQRQLNNIMTRIERTQTELRTLLSRKEDESLTEIISTLRQQEVVYQAVLEVGRRAIATSNLFEFLR